MASSGVREWLVYLLSSCSSLHSPPDQTNQKKREELTISENNEINFDILSFSFGESRFVCLLLLFFYLLLYLGKVNFKTKESK